MLELVLFIKFELRTCRARYEFDCSRSCFRAHNRIDNACGVATVLCAVGGVDLFIDLGVSLLQECDIFFDAASADVALVAHLGATEPGGGAPMNRSDIEIIANADDPDRHRVSQRAVAPERGDL